MRIPPRQRIIGLACDAGLILAFCCILVGAGHGIAPLGLVLILGDIDTWGAPKLTGWFGVLTLWSAVIFSRLWAYGLVVLAGVTLLVVAWILVAKRGETVFVTPFWVVLSGRLGYLVIQAIASWVERPDPTGRGKRRRRRLS